MSQEPIYDWKQLTTKQFIFLGLQHLFAFFGATILVPILTGIYFQGAGLSVQTTLFFAGVGTLIFHICTRFQVPAFLGSSFAFLGGFSAVAGLDSGIYSSMPMHEKLQYAEGGIVVAGLLYIVLATIVKLVGVEKVMKFLPPVVTGPIIICIGLGLAPSAINNFLTFWPLAVIALITVIVFNIFGKGMFKIIPILMGVVVSYVCALGFNALGFTNADGSAILDFTSVSEASIIGLPEFMIAKFDITAILIMAPIAIATMMEHVGDISAISATTKKNFIKDPGLHRTLIGDGLATSIAAFFGGPANTTYGENTGVLELSQIFSAQVVELAACFGIVLGFLPKISALIGTMPTSIIGGISFILYGMISAIGVRNMYENDVDLKKSRNLIIVAVIMVTGLGFTDGLTFTIGSTSITLTALALASIIGILLNAILPGNDYEFGKNEEGDINRGLNFNNLKEE